MDGEFGGAGGGSVPGYYGCRVEGDDGARGGFGYGIGWGSTAAAAGCGGGGEGEGG